MFTLFGKFKNKDWEELDNAHTKDDILTLQDIHKEEKGQQLKKNNQENH
jgi:hypothetical protein